MSDDLVKRLGIIARAEMSNYAERTVNEAATALAAAQAEIARLREALDLAIGLARDLGMTDMEEGVIRDRAALSPQAQEGTHG